MILIALAGVQLKLEVMSGFSLVIIHANEDQPLDYLIRIGNPST